MNLTIIERELVAAKPVFTTISPSWTGLFKGQAARIAKTVGLSLLVSKSAKRIYDGEHAAKIAGEFLAGRVQKAALAPVRSKITEAHKNVMYAPRRDFWRKNGMGGRSWYYKPGRHKMIIVFHDANKAGPHIDVHIGRLSLVQRVPDHIYDQLRYNSDGMLTENSRKLIMSYIQGLITSQIPIPQNLDHSMSNARASWTGGDPEGFHYGSGRTRQVVSETDVEVMKAHMEGPIEFYAPALNSHRALYLYRLPDGDPKKAPIIMWGPLKNTPPQLDDRLHLKLIHPDDMDKLEARADMRTSTGKLDGSSCYVVIDKKGTHVYSPRTSVRTGEQIEYTMKLDGIAQATSPEKVVAMGELMFRERGRWPWQRGEYLSQAAGGGILNTNDVLPEGIEPEIHLYRVDRIGRHKTTNLDFWENRSLQRQVAKLSPKFKVVELMSPDEAARAGLEGVVVVPEDASVNEGFKVKWFTDPDDWRIDRIGFVPGPKGGQAGVVFCTSLTSGKTFKLGPGQVGNRTLTEQMMENPHWYEGTVLRVASRHGHEGRAARVVGVHQDKGVAA